jgi:hypothetical protein
VVIHGQICLENTSYVIPSWKFMMRLIM